MCLKIQIKKGKKTKPSIPFNEKPNQLNNHCIKKNEILAIIGTLFLMLIQMSSCLSLVLFAHGLYLKNFEIYVY